MEPRITVITTLARSAQGRGHATRAVRMALDLLFDASKASVVRAITDARNVDSVRVLERVGFAKSAEREAIFKGESCVELVYDYHRAEAPPLGR